MLWSSQDSAGGTREQGSLQVFPSLRVGGDFLPTLFPVVAQHDKFLIFAICRLSGRWADNSWIFPGADGSGEYLSLLFSASFYGSLEVVHDLTGDYKAELKKHLITSKQKFLIIKGKTHSLVLVIHVTGK